MTTTQALYMLFGYASVMGMDRAGRLFRTAGAEMYSRLRLGEKSARTRDHQLEDDKSEEIRSQTAWGLFWLEWQVKNLRTNFACSLS